MTEQCKYIGDGRRVMESHRCKRKAAKDGYCTRHHPDYVSPLQAKAEADHEAELNMPERTKLERRITEAHDAIAAASAELKDAQDSYREALTRLHQAELALQRYDFPGIVK